MTLTILVIRLVKTSEDNNHVSLASLLHCFGTKFLSAAFLSNVPAYGNSIKALYGVAYIAAGVVY